MNELIDDLNNAVSELQTVINEIDNLRCHDESINTTQHGDLLRIAGEFEGESGEIVDIANQMFLR